MNFMTLSAVFMAMTLALFVGYGLLAHGYRRLVIEPDAIQAALRQGFAAAFVLMAVKLGWPEG